MFSLFHDKSLKTTLINIFKNNGQNKDIFLAIHDFYAMYNHSLKNLFLREEKKRKLMDLAKENLCQSKSMLGIFHILLTRIP